MSPYELYNEILIWDHNNFSRVTSEPKNPFNVSIYAKLVIDLVFSRSDFLRLVGASNECLRHIIIYYLFKHSFRIKISLLQSLRSKKTRLKARFRQN